MIRQLDLLRFPKKYDLNSISNKPYPIELR